MELFNALSAMSEGELAKEQTAALVKNGLESIVVLLYPFVPHISSQLWEELGHQESLEGKDWPEYSKDALEEEKLLIVIQVNGKLRGRISVPVDASEKAIEKEALADPKVSVFIKGNKIQKVVQVPGRLVNIVMEG